MNYGRKIGWIMLLLLGLTTSAILWVRLDSQPYMLPLARANPEEAIIVLGAGLRKDGSPGRYLKRRLDTAVEAYRLKKAPRIWVSGDNSVANYSEIAAMNTYLVSRGIPQSAIYGDYAGFDTYSTMYRARKVFGIRSALIITQDFHLPRSVFLARRFGIRTQGILDQEFHSGLLNWVRELPARVKAVLEVLLNRKPKFPGPPEELSNGSNITSEDQQKASKGVYQRNMP